ncbi:MAG TPA: phosphatase PAP2 family protein, partial [Terriglobales bacterium]|nr:phosphatase PAP2 family protein [Terriglobales bacterium]
MTSVAARPVRWMATLGLGFIAAVLAGNRGFYESSIISPYLSWALFSAFLVMALVRPSWRDAAWASAAAVAMAFIDFVILRFPAAYVSVNLHPGAPAHKWPSPAPYLSFLGLSSLAVLAIRAIWSGRGEARVQWAAVVPCVLFAATDWSATTLLDLTARLHPKTFDLFLYSFDCSLRFQPSFMVGSWFAARPLLSLVSFVFYLALPVTLGLVYGAALRRRGTAALPIAAAFVATGPLGILFYNLLPAAGPVHLFAQNFPLNPPSLADVARVVPGTVPI